MSRRTKDRRARGEQRQPTGGGLSGLVSRYRIEIGISFGLIVAVALVFGQVAHFQFVNWDDDSNIYNNPAVQGGLTWDAVVWAFTSTRLDYWHPVTWLSHELDCQWFGPWPGGHHLTSVVIHTLNVLLLFLLLRGMTGAVWRSAIVAALFAIHPLRAESVAWVTERKDVLSALFWWLATWAYVAYTKKTASWTRYGLVIVLFLMALMSKPNAMTFPFFLLLVDYWPLERLNQRSLWLLLREKIPLFALSATFAFLTFRAQRGIGTTEMAGRLSLPLRIANSVLAYATYLRDMIWPAHLAALYPYQKQLPVWQVVLAAALVATVTGLVLWKAARFRYLAVGWFWYLGVLVPVIGLVQMGLQSHADRFTYIPLTGVFILIVWGLHDLMQGWRYRTSAAIILAAVAIPALGVRAWSQVGTWRDGVTLFRHNTVVTPDNEWAWLDLAAALDQAGRKDEAIQCLTETLRLDPNNAMAYDARGVLRIHQWKLEEALSDFTHEEQIRPAAYAHYHRGAILKQLGRKDEALPELAEALRLGGMLPEFTVHAQMDLGVLLGEKGKYAEAAAQFSQALTIDPNFQPARKDLARALIGMGRNEEARKQLSALLSLNPADAEARQLLQQITAAGKP
jgi:tetratricopeptide (TPR) repeat protein